MRKLTIFLYLFSIIVVGQNQTNDELKLKEIYNAALTNSKCYSWLDYMSNKIGHRLSGSIGAEKSVEYTKSQLETLGLDRVYLQEVMVPKWVRGQKEIAYIVDNNKKINIPVCALGGSIATQKEGITAEVIEVQSLKELEGLGTEKIKGKIVFFNRPMDSSLLETLTPTEKLAIKDVLEQRKLRNLAQ